MRNPERLHEHPSFAHFSALHLHQLAECLSTSRFPAESVFFRQGDRSSDFYLVESGRVRLRRMTSFGEFRLRDLGPGDVFGAASLLDGEERDCDALALEETEVVVFNGIGLRAACERDRQFELALYWSLWKILSQELRAANRRLSRFFTAEQETLVEAPEDDREVQSTQAIDIHTKLGIFREQKLSSMEINFLASLSHQERFGPGQTIFREGEPGDKMYVVADGRVMIAKTIPGVGEEALAFLERGDYFGEMALIDEEPRSADARAHPQTGAVVLAVPRQVVAGILDIGKMSSIRLLKLLCGCTATRVMEIHEKLVGWFLLAGGDVGGNELGDELSGASSA